VIACTSRDIVLQSASASELPAAYETLVLIMDGMGAADVVQV
jgi:hypothetical protein